MKTLAQLASLVGGKIIGDDKVQIRNVETLEDAKEGDISFLANTKYRNYLASTKASAVLVKEEDVNHVTTNALVCDNPSLAFDKIINFFFSKKPEYPVGVHPSAVIHESVVVGADVAIGPHVVVEPGVKIGNRSVIWANSFIGKDSVIGEDSFIYPNVSIRENVQIRSNVIIHCGSVIGSDGYGYEKTKDGLVKISQNGGVVLEDYVEIGANVTIDRARFQNTVIGKGTKIDNLVQIAHNVQIGNDCLIVSQVGVSGSTKIGNESILAGQVGVVGHIKIGDKVIIGAQSGVSNDIPSDSIVLGSPTQDIRAEKKQLARIKRLDKLFEKVKILEKEMASLINDK